MSNEQELTIREIHELCDKADEIDPSTYFILCEDDSLTTEQFVDGLRKIINSIQ